MFLFTKFPSVSVHVEYSDVVRITYLVSLLWIQSYRKVSDFGFNFGWCCRLAAGVVVWVCFESSL